MEENKYLNEENYERGKKKIIFVSVLILLCGLLAGGSLIYAGINKQSKINDKYSDGSKTALSSQIQTEKEVLENKKRELESRGITFDEFAEYTDGEKYDLKIITNALDPSFDHCNFDEYKNNNLTSNYCSLKNQLEDNDDFNKEFDSMGAIPFYMIGGFIIISTCMLSGSIYMFAKRREITAFTAQQVMPVAQEGIEKMAPTIGNAAGEIAKGIKKGLNDDDKE